jgi:5-methylcytosine-specific restriction protein A
MPTRLMGPCKTLSCPNTRTASSPYCGSCAAAGNGPDQYRGSAAARGYGHNWRKLRLMVLRRHPMCADPFGIGCISVSLHADHIIPKRQGGEDIMENLQGLCDSCHSRKTLLEQSFTFVLPSDGTPALFTSCGRIIQLFTAASAPPEARPIAAWPKTVASSVWGQGWVKSLEPSPARPPVGHAHVVAK